MRQITGSGLIDAYHELQGFLFALDENLAAAFASGFRCTLELWPMFASLWTACIRSLVATENREVCELNP